MAKYYLLTIVNIMQWHDNRTYTEAHMGICMSGVYSSHIETFHYVIDKNKRLLPINYYELIERAKCKEIYNCTVVRIKGKNKYTLRGTKGTRLSDITKEINFRASEDGYTMGEERANEVAKSMYMQIMQNAEVLKILGTLE